MPCHADELSRFFDDLHDELRKDWERRVDHGHMTERTKQHKLARLDDIGAILRALGEGHAALTYQQSPPREPGVPIFVLPRVD